MINDSVIEMKFLQPRSNVMAKVLNPCKLDQMADKKNCFDKKISKYINPKKTSSR